LRKHPTLHSIALWDSERRVPFAKTLRPEGC
jgi:hypothetical protein